MMEIVGTGLKKYLGRKDYWGFYDLPAISVALAEPLNFAGLPGHQSQERCEQVPETITEHNLRSPDNTAAIAAIAHRDHLMAQVNRPGTFVAPEALAAANEIAIVAKLALTGQLASR